MGCDYTSPALNGYLAAAQRLIPVTHDDAQHILTGLRPECVTLATQAAASDPLTMAGGAPLAEIWSMQHETASVRLFAS